MFSRSRCLLWTVSQSLRIFSLTRLISLAVNWSSTESSCSSSSRLIISSRQDRSRSIFSRSRLSMYIRDAVQRARFCQIQRNSEQEREEANVPNILPQLLGVHKHIDSSIKRWTNRHKTLKIKLLCIIRAVAISRFLSTSRFWKNIDFILLASTNRQNTGSAAFHGREYIKHIIRLFSKAAWY